MKHSTLLSGIQGGFRTLVQGQLARRVVGDWKGGWGFYFSAVILFDYAWENLELLERRGLKVLVNNSRLVTLMALNM